MKFLYLAYGATWAIHVLYILYLNGRFRRLRDELKDLERR
jgi:CcmD family protein